MIRKVSHSPMYECQLVGRNICLAKTRALVQHRHFHHIERFLSSRLGRYMCCVS